MTSSVPISLSEARPTIHNSLIALTMVGVMVAGAWQFRGALYNPDGLEFPRSMLDFREGRTTQTLEKQLDHKLPARSELIALANSLRYLVTGGGGDQVRVGKSDWLFLTEELRYDGASQQPLEVRADLLGTTTRLLREQGVQLVIALVPDKARIYENHLSDHRYPDYNRLRYENGLSALRQRGVTVVDLLAPLSEAARHTEVYYRSDTHWNQAGARVAAQAIAQVTATLPISFEKTIFETTTSPNAVERPGDLIRLMGLEFLPNAMRPTPDHEAPASTSPTHPDSGAGGLFGNTTTPVTLIGTSYSMRGNFHGYLQQALSAKVLNTAKDGGGFLQAATDYLRDDAFRSAKPALLIWELPERFLLNKIGQEPGWLKAVGMTH